MPKGRATSGDQRAAFLAGLARGLTVAHAAAAIGLHRTNMYDWRWRDAAFARAWDRAVARGLARLRTEAARRVSPPAARGRPPFTDAGSYSDSQLLDALRRLVAGAGCAPPRTGPARRQDGAPAEEVLAQRLAAAMKRLQTWDGS